MAQEPQDGQDLAPSSRRGEGCRPAHGVSQAEHARRTHRRTVRDASCASVQRRRNESMDTEVRPQTTCARLAGQGQPHLGLQPPGRGGGSGRPCVQAGPRGRWGGGGWGWFETPEGREGQTEAAWEALRAPGPRSAHPTHTMPRAGAPGVPAGSEQRGRHLLHSPLSPKGQLFHFLKSEARC